MYMYCYPGCNWNGIKKGFAPYTTLRILFGIKVLWDQLTTVKSATYALPKFPHASA